MFLMLFYKSEKHVFMFFYLQINVFNIYDSRVSLAGTSPLSSRATCP